APLHSCPTRRSSDLLQMPIFFALYWVLLESVELRHAPWIGWIQDLTARDPWFILPVINVAVMWATQKLSPMTGMDPMQQRMMQMMPLVFGVMMVFFPAGRVLYWVTNGGLGLLQQWYMLRKYGEPAPAKACSEAVKPASRRASSFCTPMNTRRAEPTDTIAAIATPSGAGGVGIVRLSGPDAAAIARQLCGRDLQPRHAHHVRFRDADAGVIDDGIALAFIAPASFTGEDVVEL